MVFIISTCWMSMYYSGPFQVSAVTSECTLCCLYYGHALCVCGCSLFHCRYSVIILKVFCIIFLLFISRSAAPPRKVTQPLSKAVLRSAGRVSFCIVIFGFFSSFVVSFTCYNFFMLYCRSSFIVSVFPDVCVCVCCLLCLGA